ALGRIRARIGDADKLAGVGERPRVIETLEGLRVPLGLAAEDRAAMRARVEIRAHPVRAVAREDERPAGECPLLEVAGLWYLALVAKVEPLPVPDLALTREDLL